MRRLYCNECGRPLSWETCIPATWMGKRVCLCKSCAYSVAPGLAPRLNPRKSAYWASTHPAWTPLGYQCLCGRYFSSTTQLYDHVLLAHSPSEAERILSAKQYEKYLRDSKKIIGGNPLTPEVCKFCGAKIYGPYWGPLQVCPRCGRKQSGVRNPGPTLEALKAGVRIKKRYPQMDVRVRNPISLYQKFHGNPPARRRKVNVPMPKKGTVLTVLGRMPEIRYTPYNPSQYAGTTFRHKWGDTGRVMLPGKPLLATDGKDFYIIKDGKSAAKFTERGIIG